MIDIAPFSSDHSLRLVLIRHGEPEQAANGKCPGKIDFGLSEKGRSQIQAKVSSVRELSVEALYTSPIRRAAESAAIAGLCLQLHAVARPEVQEIDFGRFEGLSYTQIEQLFPREYKLWMDHPTIVTFPGGESFAEMKKRVLEFKDFLLKTNAGKTVLVVSHGGTNRMLLAEALGIADEMVFRLDQGYAAMNIIDYFSSHTVVRLMNG